MNYKEKAMQVKLQLTIVTQYGDERTTAGIVILNKDSERIEQLGMTLSESKEMLKAI
jgi:hypothetical protein